MISSWLRNVSPINVNGQVQTRRKRGTAIAVSALYILVVVHELFLAHHLIPQDGASNNHWKEFAFCLHILHFYPQQWKFSVQKVKEKENMETLASKKNILLYGEEAQDSYNT